MSDGVQRLLRVERNTRDLDRAIAFYRDALCFSVADARAPPPAWTRLPGVEATPARWARLSLGAQQIELTEFPDGAPCPADSTACDLGFQHLAIVVEAMDAARDRVLRAGAAVITRGGPQTLPPSTGSVEAFKFRDPDGHPLELIAFPDGVGDRAWHSSPAPGPMLGIDHSAISVGDVRRSIAFYTLLGLSVAGRSVNQGPEQQRLDALANVEVDVIALQGVARTPHLELLGYRRPAGRANAERNVDAIAADRVVWQAAHIDEVLRALAAAGFSHLVVASGHVAGACMAVLRDPDGHLMVLTDAGR